jgi:short-subunit dehydrogenase
MGRGVRRVRIAGSVAVVTGASSGIGRAVALELARRGARVVLVARRRAELEATAAACGRHTPGALAVVADVSSPEDCRRVAAVAEERLGGVDVLVNNAGIGLHKHAARTTPEEVERVLRVNFLGAVHLTAAVLPGMLERRRGSIVNVTSVAGAIPNPREAAYGASKAALAQWTHGLAVDLAGSGVHAGAVSPGPIDTEIWTSDSGQPWYRGRKYPPEVVARAVVRVIERGEVHRTSPRRFGAIGAVYPLPLVGRALRMGLVRFGQASERRA